MRRPNRVALLTLFLCGFVSVQRFTLESISTLVCAVPFIMFLVQMVGRSKSSALTVLVVALLLSVGNGGGAYLETVAPLRYAIYLSAVGMLFYLSEWRVVRKPFVVAVLLCIGVGFGTALNLSSDGALDGPTIRRDLLVLVVLSAFLLRRGSAHLDIRLLFAACLGYLVGEFFNAIFFYGRSDDYLSYDGLKVFVIFPLVYSILSRQNVVVTTALMVMTAYVVLLYGSRMIVLLGILFFVAAYLYEMRRLGARRIIISAVAGGAFIFGIYLVVPILKDEFESYKAFSFIIQALDGLGGSDVLSVIALLDPVRFAEHVLFFNRSMIEIIFGSGLGSGLIDLNGELAFVSYDQTAFSAKEIDSSVFYNLHDFWIDFGLRFGLLYCAYVFFEVTIREMVNGRPWHGFLYGMLLLNTTFSTAGILFTALIVRHLPFSREA